MISAPYQYCYRVFTRGDRRRNCRRNRLHRPVAPTVARFAIGATSCSDDRLVYTLHYLRTKRRGNIPTRTPLTGTSNAGGVCRNRDSASIYGFTACCQRCDRPGVIYTLHSATEPRSRMLWTCDTYRLLMAGDDDEMFMTRSLNVTPKTTEQRI